MFYPLSAQSEMTRAEAACGLAILAREVCDEAEIFTFSNEVVKIPPRRGFALRDKVVGRSGTAGRISARPSARSTEGRSPDRLHR